MSYPILGNHRTVTSFNGDIPYFLILSPRVAGYCLSPAVPSWPSQTNQLVQVAVSHFMMVLQRADGLEVLRANLMFRPRDTKRLSTSQQFLSSSQITGHLFHEFCSYGFWVKGMWCQSQIYLCVSAIYSRFMVFSIATEKIYKRIIILLDMSSHFSSLGVIWIANQPRRLPIATSRSISPISACRSMLLGWVCSCHDNHVLVHLLLLMRQQFETWQILTSPLVWLS